MSLSFRFFAVLLFLSAFLLFFIQPLASRIILPILGGTPIVWTTSMLFFQTLLLGGYLWAHLMIRIMPSWLPPVLQTIIAIVTIFFIDYQTPLAFDAGQENAVWWQFKTLFLMIGLPYLALATNSPLYQAIYKEFKAEKSEKTPYALYSISNIGSFLALLGYPFLIEPLFAVDVQASLWRYGYIALSCMISFSGFVCLGLSLKGKNRHSIRKSSRHSKNAPTLSTMGLWCLIAFIPSSLMLGVTTYVTTDIASVPLFWIIPLAFYLASFVMAFAEPRLWLAKNVLLLNILTFMSLILIFNILGSSLHVLGWVEICLHFMTFLFVATSCHLRLSNLKPDPEHLTLFYFIISVGGCLGGLFNALIAPDFFIIPVEYILTLLLFVALYARYPEKFDDKISLRRDVPIVMIVSALYLYMNFVMEMELTYILLSAFILAIVMAFYANTKFIFLLLAALCTLSYTNNKIGRDGETVLLSRNVFGSMVIKDVREENKRVLLHGTTIHGIQPLPLSDAPYLTSYYHKQGPLGDIFAFLDAKNGSQHIAALGLGIGTVACYKKPGREFRFFEINPDMIKIARDKNYFTYLSSCAPDAKIILGDARVSMVQENKMNNKYDLVLVDTFSSDSIPLHLITKEAVDIYKESLKPEGIIAFHISNRYFDLSFPLAGIAKELELSYAINHTSKKGQDKFYVDSVYVILSKDKKTIDSFTHSNPNWKILKNMEDLPLWTDDHANILGAIK